MSAVAHNPLTAARLEAGLTVEQLAHAAKLSPTGVARIEASLARRPHRSTIEALAEHLPLTADQLDAALFAHTSAVQTNWSGDSELPQDHQLPKAA